MDHYSPLHKYYALSSNRQAPRFGTPPYLSYLDLYVLDISQYSV